MRHKLWLKWFWICATQGCCKNTWFILSLPSKLLVKTNARIKKYIFKILVLKIQIYKKYFYLKVYEIHFAHAKHFHFWSISLNFHSHPTLVYSRTYFFRTVCSNSRTKRKPELSCGLCHNLLSMNSKNKSDNLIGTWMRLGVDQGMNRMIPQN